MSWKVLIIIIYCLTSADTGVACPSFCQCSYYSRTHTMECVSQELQKIPDNIPEWTTLLDLDGNELPTFDLQFCRVCVYFEEISLRYNRICNIKTSSTNSTDLKQGKLCQNLPPLFPRLRNVNLKGNLMQELPKCLLFVWPALKILNLNENRIRSIRSLNLIGLAAHTNSLEELYLRDNMISHLLRRNFYSSTVALRRLIVLDLSKNRIHTIESGVFTFFDDLKEVNLSENKLGYLPDFAFVTRGERLEKISLKSNYIDWISLRTFAGLSNLKVLDLSRNAITCLVPNTWSTCQLSSIFPDIDTQSRSPILADPDTAHFLKRFAVDFQSLRTVYVSYNKWFCDCNLHGLIFKKSVLNVSPRLFYCDAPVAYRNKSVETVLNEIDCMT